MQKVVSRITISSYPFNYSLINWKDIKNLKSKSDFLNKERYTVKKQKYVEHASLTGFLTNTNIDPDSKDKMQTKLNP